MAYFDRIRAYSKLTSGKKLLVPLFCGGISSGNTNTLTLMLGLKVLILSDLAAVDDPEVID